MAKKRSGRRKSTSVGEESIGDEDLIESTEASTPNQAVASNRIIICKSTNCRDVAQVSSFCRLHYLANWRNRKTKEAKTEGAELENYLKQLRNRFPEEFFEKLKAEVEDIMSNGSKDSSDNESSSRGFDSNDGDEDMDTIIKGIRVEDF